MLSKMRRNKNEDEDENEESSIRELDMCMLIQCSIVMYQDRHTIAKCDVSRFEHQVEYFEFS